MKLQKLEALNDFVVLGRQILAPPASELLLGCSGTKILAKAYQHHKSTFIRWLDARGTSLCQCADPQTALGTRKLAALLVGSIAEYRGFLYNVWLRQRPVASSFCEVYLRTLNIKVVRSSR